MERLPDSDVESQDTLKQKFPGRVTETMQVPERNQVSDKALGGGGQADNEASTHTAKLTILACISSLQLAFGSKLPCVATSNLLCFC